MKKINIFFRQKPEMNRWLPGDRFIIPIIRKIIRRKKIGGVEKVFINLCKGLDKLKVDYAVNLPFKLIKTDESVIVLGVGKYALEGYRQPNKVIAGIGLMTHPAEWPDLCEQYPIAKYLQHSDWANNVYKPYFGDHVCNIWPAGIDTAKWIPAISSSKKYDFLLYNKIRWDKPKIESELKSKIIQKITSLGLSYKELIYGEYREPEYQEILSQSRAMIFLCEHESQGFACCEAMSMNVPIFAWDQGWWLDTDRFEWGTPDVPATSIPFFNENCGMSFVDFPQFENLFLQFWHKVKQAEFSPRQYIIENLSLEKSAEKMLSIIKEVYAS